MYMYVLVVYAMVASVILGVMRREMGRAGGTKRSICLSVMLGIQLSVVLSLFSIFQEYSQLTWIYPDRYVMGILVGMLVLPIAAHTGPLHGETMTMGDHGKLSAMACLSIMTIRFTIPCLIMFGVISYLNPHLSDQVTLDSLIRIVVTLSLCTGAIPGLVYYATKHGFGITNYTEVSEFVYPILYHSAMTICIFFFLFF